MSGLSSSSSLSRPHRSSSMVPTSTRQGCTWSHPSQGRMFRREEYVNDPHVRISESRRRRHVTSTMTHHPVDPDSVKQKMEAQLNAAQTYIDSTIEQHHHRSRQQKVLVSKPQTVPVVIHHHASRRSRDCSIADDRRSERSSMPSTPALERLATPDISDVDDDWEFCSCCPKSNPSKCDDFIVVDHPHVEGSVCRDCVGHEICVNQEVSFDADKRNARGLPRLGWKIM